MSIREQAFELTNRSGEVIRCDLRLPAGEGPFPVVVVLHGFKGFKDWGMFPPTARRLAEDGVATVALNTSRNGVGEELTEFTELEQFAQNTPGHEEIDVRCVVDAIAAGNVDVELDASRIGLLGHSFGGGVVLLAASRDERIRCVVTWAAISTFDRYTDRAKEEWRAKGRLDIPNQRTGQIMWLDAAVLDDRDQNEEAYDVKAACGRIQAPLLVIHGEQDEAVGAKAAFEISAWAGSRLKNALVVPATGHTFGAVHPWAGPSDAWETVVGATSGWFVEHL